MLESSSRELSAKLLSARLRRSRRMMLLYLRDEIIAYKHGDGVTRARGSLCRLRKTTWRDGEWQLSTVFKGNLSRFLLARFRLAVETQLARGTLRGALALEVRASTTA